MITFNQVKKEVLDKHPIILEDKYNNLSEEDKIKLDNQIEAEQEEL